MVAPPMKMSARGRVLLEQREGCDLKASLSGIPNDPWTIGYGHTHFDGPPIPVEGMTITKVEADEMLTRDLVRYENIVNKNVTAPLVDHEFDALTSICYNVEAALSEHSSIVKDLNAGDRGGAAAAIMLYDKPPEIIGRRKTEQHQFETPYPAAMPAKGSSVASQAPIPTAAALATQAPLDIVAQLQAQIAALQAKAPASPMPTVAAGSTASPLALDLKAIEQHFAGLPQVDFGAVATAVSAAMPALSAALTFIPGGAAAAPVVALVAAIVEAASNAQAAWKANPQTAPDALAADLNKIAGLLPGIKGLLPGPAAAGAAA